MSEQMCDKCGSTDDVIDINADAPYQMPEKHLMCANCCEAEWTRQQERKQEET